jgi:hypothetical protein
VFLNGVPIYWGLKKQTSCETSTFGSEFIAMKQATEYVHVLRYKLQMMGITVNEPMFVFGDNQSVLANMTAPASTLKKKSNLLTTTSYPKGVLVMNGKQCILIQMTILRTFSLSLWLV